MTTDNASTLPIKSAIIVGAGPSGLILSLLLSRSNPPISVTILEAASDLDTNPRAAHYAPSACYDLDRAGVLDDVRAQGFHPDSVCWRRPDGTLLGGLGWKTDEFKIESGPMVCLPLDRLDRLLYDHLLRYPTAEVLFRHRVVAVDQSQREARVEVEVEGKGEAGVTKERKWLTADYVVGSDGANSMVRRCLFGETNYPGETLEKQIIATNVYYDFHKFAYWDSNFIVHPTDWYMAAKITSDGLWRVTYGDDWGLTNAEYLARQPERFKRILPGNPTPDMYTLVSASPYKLHQRCAPSFRVGRVVLVADAAHLCNPFGGLGLTGGIADVGSLYDALMHTQHGRCDDSILDEYSRVRIQKWTDTIDPMSRKNFDLIWNPSDESEMARKEFWGFCEKLKSDKSLSQAMANSTHALRENFDGYVKGWQERQKSNPTTGGVLNGDAGTNGINGDGLGAENSIDGDIPAGKNGISIEHAETVDAPVKQTRTKAKTKILGYGTSVTID